MEKKDLKNRRIVRSFLLIYLLVFTFVSCFAFGKVTAEAASVKRPAKVTSVKASVTGHSSVKISWKKQNATGYKIYRSTKKKSGYKLVKTTSSTTWTNSGLKPGKTYYYKIKAYNKSGKKSKMSSKYSSTVKAKPYIGTPGSVKVSVAGNRSLKISWNKSKYAKSYQIYRATSKNGKYTKIKTTSGTSYTNSGLTTGKTYYYKVRAYNKVGKKTYYSSYSSKKSGKTYIGAASSVKASSAGYNSAKITWNAGKYAKGYQVYRATSKSGKYTKIKTTTGTSYTDTGLSTNKTYYYKIRSYNTIGSKYYYSGYSSIVNAKPIPATPTGVSAKLNEDAITIKWNAVSGTSKYYIYRNDGKTFSTTSTSYTDNTVETGKAYQYRVRAYRTVYSGYSSWSSKVIVSQEAYLDYNKDGNTANATRIYIGQEWTDSLNASLNGGTPVEKLLERDHPQYYEGGTESVYVYDTEDFDNFLIVYVKGGKIIAWQTSAEVLGVYNGITLRRGTPATDYEDFEEWGNSYEFIPYLSVAKVKATNIDIGEIFFGGVVSSMNEWDLRCSDNLEAEELLCEYTVNALRVVNGRVIMEHNEYLYGKEDEYGTKAEAKTMAISNELAHGILPEGPLAGLTGTEKGTLISNASGGTVVSGGQNIANGGCGESVVWMWFRSAGHSQSLMASGALNSNFEETNIMAAAVYPTADGSRYYWSWEHGYYKIDYGVKAPTITINEVGENSVNISWIDTVSDMEGYSYVREFSLFEDFSEIESRYSGKAVSMTRTDLQAGTTYYVRIRAQAKINGAIRNSDWSEVISFTTLLPEPEVSDEPVIEEDDAVDEPVDNPIVTTDDDTTEAPKETTTDTSVGAIVESSKDDNEIL